MLDDFRQQAGASMDEEEENLEVPSAPSHVRTKFLGMTPVQTFVIALMLLGLTCLLSVFCLLASGKVVPPFL
jgi:hypothetical protein